MSQRLPSCFERSCNGGGDAVSERAETAGKPDAVVHNGWAFYELGDGGIAPGFGGAGRSDQRKKAVKRPRVETRIIMS